MYCCCKLRWFCWFYHVGSFGTVAVAELVMFLLIKDDGSSVELLLVVSL